MRILLQRVSRASVQVDGTVVGEIGAGLLALVGVGQGDDESAADRLVDKMVALRIFPDEGGKMNRSVADIAGGVLMISQFTLYADCRKGRRPSFVAAAPPEQAQRIYAHAVERVRAAGVPTASGTFAADMQVSLINDGPVTILLDSEDMRRE